MVLKYNQITRYINNNECKKKYRKIFGNKITKIMNQI